MIDVTLTINDLALGSRLTSYSADMEITYERVVETLDGHEHEGKQKRRRIINFSVIPGTEAEQTALYNVLKNKTVTVTYTNPDETGSTSTKTMRVVSNLNNAFLLRSMDGFRRYKGSVITLRASDLEE